MKKMKSKQQKKSSKVKKTFVKKAAKKNSLMKKIMSRFSKVRNKGSAKKSPKKMGSKNSSKKVAVSQKKSSAKKMKPLSKKLSKKHLQKELKSKKMKKSQKPSVLKKSQKVKMQKEGTQKSNSRILNENEIIASFSQNSSQGAAHGSLFTHESVLVQEVLENLQLGDKKVVVDGTLGLGGHSKNMLEAMSADAQLVAFDVDDDNMKTAQQNLQSFGDRVMFVRSNFAQLQEELAKLNIKNVDAILLDLGLSSPQVDNPAKGFSFLREGALDMRFDKSETLTAAEVVNNYSMNELARIFQQYGEEPFARKIATEIVRRRKARSFKTTTELANFIEKLIGRKGHIHPATRVFQALRIEVNHELDVLRSALEQAVQVLKKHGRLAVIAYHSLEDRVVKQFFKECARDFINEPDKLTTTHLKPTLHIVTKKPLVPTDAEISKNPRSRSAKLRVAEKI